MCGYRVRVGEVAEDVMHVVTITRDQLGTHIPRHTHTHTNARTQTLTHKHYT